MTDIPTPPDTDLTYQVIEASVRDPDHTDLVLSPDRQYDDLTDAEKHAHRGFNGILGACDIPDPVRVGDYYGIVLDDHARSRFEAGESYTPDELVDVCVALFEDIQHVMQMVHEILREARTPSETRLSLLSPDGESVETSEAAFSARGDPPTAFVDADSLPEADFDGWGLVCSKDGEVVFSGAVDAVRGPDADGVVDMECVEDSDE